MRQRNNCYHDDHAFRAARSIGVECRRSDSGANRYRIGRGGLEPIAAIYSSPLLRAKVTADAVADRFNLPVMPDARLMEYDFGAISGMTWNEVTATHPELANRWLEDPWAVPVAGSEGRVNFAARVMSAMQDICARHAAEHVAIVAHGGTFGVYLTTRLGLDLNRRHPFHFGNTSWSVVEVRDGVLHIHSLNNTCHLS
jgi:broad specificity phosphatase PhoE